MARPSTVFSWATGGGAYVSSVIANALRSLGNVPGTTVLAESVNTALNEIGDWVAYLGDISPATDVLNIGRIVGIGDPVGGTAGLFVTTDGTGSGITITATGGDEVSTTTTGGGDIVAQVLGTGASGGTATFGVLGGGGGVTPAGISVDHDTLVTTLDGAQVNATATTSATITAPTIALAGSVTVDDLTIDGTSSGFTSTGELTHADATCSYAISYIGFLVGFGGADAIFATPSGWSISTETFGGVDYRCAIPDISTSAEQAAFFVQIPQGATITKQWVRAGTPSGGSGGGGVTMIVYQITNSLSGTTEQSNTISVAAPGAGNVTLSIDTTLPFSAAEEGTEVIVYLGVANDTPGVAGSIAFVDCGIEWTFTQPGDY